MLLQEERAGVEIKVPGREDPGSVEAGRLKCSFDAGSG